VLEIVGLGQACAVALRDLAANMEHMQQMRDRLQAGLQQRLSDLRVNGHPTRRLPNTLSVSFAHLQAHDLLAAMPGVAASSGSACHADTVEISSVLAAMRVPLDEAMGTIRFSVGKMTTVVEIDQAIDRVVQAVRQLRQTGTEFTARSNV
jgi:cysteine desulfurase